ncbi:major capsid protein [Riemerella columbina]|uniref:major capsid protein n=1 Tax=Riemerella columbina TaxID=103810 RepID=UPI00037521D4|nr:major capsid protein [Riemerella columbina]
MAELSVFGAYAENMQTLIDTRQDKFNQPWFTKYFDWDTPQISLDYTSVLGEAVINAMATVVARDSETPLATREALAKITGEIPAIKRMIPLNENQYRHYMSLLNMPGVKDQQKKMQALKLIWDDVKKVVDAVYNRIDYLALQAVSTGKIDINIDNNPDGIIVPDIDLQMPSENKTTVSTSWSDANNATPIQDIQNIVNASNSDVAKVLITKTKMLEMMRTKEVRDTLGAFFGLTKASTSAETAPLTLSRLNKYMAESEMPVFEVVDKKVSVEKNGVPTITSPFEAKNIAFIPDGKLGVIKNALAVEEMNPVEHIKYANSGRVLVSKWKQNEPFREYTKAECNAWPVIEAINSIRILTTEK